MLLHYLWYVIGCILKRRDNDDNHAILSIYQSSVQINLSILTQNICVALNMIFTLYSLNDICVKCVIWATLGIGHTADYVRQIGQIL